MHNKSGNKDMYLQTRPEQNHVYYLIVSFVYISFKSILSYFKLSNSAVFKFQHLIKVIQVNVKHLLTVLFRTI